jgi:F-type H+-transporting ATPase subunit delta
MDLGVISVRYARALLKSATGLSQEDAVYKDMQLLLQSYIQVPQLRFTIDNPIIAKEKKMELVETAAGGNASEITRRFIQLVFKEGRESSLQLMAASYITLYRKQKNITRGKLTTAVAVSAETEAKMKQMVEQKTHGTVEFNVEVDPDIIGGFILEYDTYRMDASVKTKLNSVLTTLLK